MGNLIIKNSSFIISRRLVFLFVCGSGSLGFSILIVYKYLKLKKFVLKLDQNVKKLSAELESISRTQQNIEFNKSIAAESKERFRPICRRSSSSSYTTPSTSPERKETNFKEQKYEILKEKFEINQKYFSKKADFIETIEFLKLINALDEKEDDADLRRKYRFCAFDIAKRCIEFYSESYLAHKWYAIFIGKISEFCSISEKVKYGFEFKKHLDTAIEMNQDDSVLFYLRGRWFYKMYNLSWPEKYAVKLFCGKMPEITIDNALDDFSNAEKLNPKKQKSNLLYLAKCLLKKKEKEKALNLMNEASKMKSQTIEEEKDEKELIDLIIKNE